MKRWIVFLTAIVVLGGASMGGMRAPSLTTTQSAGTVTDGAIGLSALDDFLRGDLGICPKADTLYVQWRANADGGGSAGYYLVQVTDGDTLSLTTLCHTAKGATSFDLSGPGCGSDLGRPTYWCSTWMGIIVPRNQVGMGIYSLDTPGSVAANKRTTILDSTFTEITNDRVRHLLDREIVFACDTTTAAADSVKMRVIRTIEMGPDPYFTIRYRIKNLESGPDSLRFLFYDSPALTGGGPLPALYDLYWSPQYGEVRREHVFDSSPIPCLAIFNIGNPLAPLDTLGGASAYLNPALKVDCGSGTARWYGSFVAVNPAGIGVDMIAVVDTSETNYRYAHFDSIDAVVDTTTIMGDEKGAAGSAVFIKSNLIVLTDADWQVFEIAIGRAFILNDASPIDVVIPRVTYQGGTTAGPYYRGH